VYAVDSAIRYAGTDASWAESHHHESHATTTPRDVYHASRSHYTQRVSTAARVRKQLHAVRSTPCMYAAPPRRSTAATPRTR